MFIITNFIITRDVITCTFEYCDLNEEYVVASLCNINVIHKWVYVNNLIFNFFYVIIMLLLF